MRQAAIGSLESDATYQAVLAAVKSGEIPESRIDESVRRIEAMKEKAGLFKNRFVDENKVSEVFSHKEDFAFAQQVADNGVILVRIKGYALPMEREPDVSLEGKEESPRRLVVILFTDSERSPLGSAFEEELKTRRPDAKVFHVHYDDRDEPSQSEVVQAVQSADEVLVGASMTNAPGRRYVYGGRIVNVVGLNGPTARLFGEIVGVGEKNVMVVSLGSPYLILHYPTIQNYVCTFSVSSTSERAAVRALFGEIHNHARMPVILPGVADLGFAIEWPQRQVQ